MVNINTLLKEGKINYINELEVDRYINFFDNSYKDNLEHCRRNINDFPRWSIISGYYAMHDITKLYIAKKHRIKIEKEVHAITIKILREIIKDNSILVLLEFAYKEFLTLANDLEEAKKERVKVQYYTGTSFLKGQYKERAKEFYEKTVIPYINKIKEEVKW